MGIIKKIKEMDMIAELPSSKLHFGGVKSASHKTFLGGLGTCCAILLFLSLSVYMAVPIYQMKQPYIKSQSQIAPLTNPDTGKPWTMKTGDGSTRFFALVD